jgi:hypothetical protein
MNTMIMVRMRMTMITAVRPIMTLRTSRAMPAIPTLTVTPMQSAPTE